MAWKRFVVEWVISRSRSSVVRLVVVLVVDRCGASGAV